ncbi:Hypothetical protein, putative [Bodo saltans]|uniref:Uncharacterized protein n=1 Tax=Bodo saltans TaxID=75058 RepID=A0A0S4IW03_BODSA|nr:Hypothetical protein, putative [Bodo saltans]|eukprot:CUG23525.1 Hypothetical protein, putative [Bodo saltans]
MAALPELNKQLLLSRSELIAAIESGAEAAAGLGTSSSSSALSVEGLLVRVTVPKREWERLIIAVLPFVDVGASPSEHIDPATERGKVLAKKQADLRSSIEKGTATSFCRVGVVRSVVFHVVAAGQPPTPYFLVDLGDCEETFTTKQIHERPQDTTDAEIALLVKLMALLGKRPHSMEQCRLLLASVAAIRQRASASTSSSSSMGIGPGQFKLSSSAALHNTSEASSAALSGDQDNNNSNNMLIIQQQRDLIQQLKQELEQKNRDLYQTTLQMRAQQQQSEAHAKELSAQIQNLADLHQKQAADHEVKEGKMKLLLDTVRQLHVILKLAREKLNLPQGSPEAIERALREATVVPRGQTSS